MSFKLISMCATFALAIFGATSANSAVTYTLHASDVSFVYTTPNYVTPNITVNPADLTSCTALPAGATCGTVQFFLDSSTGFDDIAFNKMIGGNLNTFIYDFGVDTFETNGTYTPFTFYTL